MKEHTLSLEEIQNRSFIVLVELKHILDKHKWKYYLAYGTLIGAIRHKGFIPWDDDVDIYMPRKDYEEFIQYCKDNEKKLGYFKLFHYKTCRKYIYSIARFSDTRYKVIYNQKKDYGLGVFVDIYPLDVVKNDNQRIYRKILRRNYIIETAGYSSFVKTNSILKNIIKYPYWMFLSKCMDIGKLIRKNDLLSQSFRYSDSNYVANICWSFEGEYHLYKKEWFGEGIDYPFNGEKFRIPTDYHKVLSIEYGDYMKLPPINKRIARHNYFVILKDE